MKHVFAGKHRSNGHCVCDSRSIHHAGWDTYYCADTGEWLEPVCGCPDDDDDGACPVRVFERTHGLRPSNALRNTPS